MLALILSIAGSFKGFDQFLICQLPDKVPLKLDL